VALARTLHPEVEFAQGDAERLQFADDSFDAVGGNFAIPHLGRPERAVAEFARVLSPRGRVALSTWDVPSAPRLPGAFYDAIQEVGAPPPSDLPTGPPFYGFADEPAFTGLLRDAGLVDLTVSTVAFSYHFVGDLFDCLVDGTVRAVPRIRPTGGHTSAHPGGPRSTHGRVRRRRRVRPPDLSQDRQRAAK
jgi:SAM-dependent methyltransferase